MEDDKNIVYFTDEDGQQLPLMMIDTFDYKDESYAIFVTPFEYVQQGDEPGVYVMKVQYENDEISDFIMPSDEEMEALTPTVMERLENRQLYDASECGGSCCNCHSCDEPHTH